MVRFVGFQEGPQQKKLQIQTKLEELIEDFVFGRWFHLIALHWNQMDMGEGKASTIRWKPNN